MVMGISPPCSSSGIGPAFGAFPPLLLLPGESSSCLWPAGRWLRVEVLGSGDGASESMMFITDDDLSTSGQNDLICHWYCVIRSTVDNWKHWWRYFAGFNGLLCRTSTTFSTNKLSIPAQAQAAGCGYRYENDAALTRRVGDSGSSLVALGIRRTCGTSLYNTIHQHIHSRQVQSPHSS